MKKILFFFKFVFILMFSLSIYAVEDKQDMRKETKQETDDKTTTKIQKKIFINYRPPAGMSMPLNREGAGTRGIGDEEQYLAILVPNHAALTIKEQPVLFWYLSNPTPDRIEITINSEASFEPVLETALSSPEKAGVQRLSLSNYDTSLLPEIEYQWFISIVTDPDQRSKDISATGLIKHIKSSKTLSEKLAKAKGKEIPVIYADEGLWYDALSSISELIDASPDNKLLHEMRNSLFEQVGLQIIADYERKNL